MRDEPVSWPGRREGDPRHDRLASFLALDLQRSPEWIADLLAKIEAVGSGDLSCWERRGNAYHLRFDRRGAVLEDTVDREATPVVLPLADLRAAVEAWRDRVRAGTGP